MVLLSVLGDTHDHPLLRDGDQTDSNILVINSDEDNWKLRRGVRSPVHVVEDDEPAHNVSEREDHIGSRLAPTANSEIELLRLLHKERNPLLLAQTGLAMGVDIPKKKQQTAGPFVCHICGKRWRQKLHLQNHIFTHTGETPYKCILCSKGFRTKGNLKTHMGGHISRYGDLKCPVCNEVFPTRTDCHNHLASEHILDPLKLQLS